MEIWAVNHRNQLSEVSLQLDCLLIETRWQRLGQLVGLFGVRDAQCVQIARASDFEFGLIVSLADFDVPGVGAARLLQKIANVFDFFRHCDVKCEPAGKSETVKGKNEGNLYVSN